MTKFASRAGIAGLLAACALSASAPAFAGDDVLVSYANNGAITRTISVPTSDLQLGTAAGRNELDNRIVAAARKACGREPVFGISQPRDYERCFAATKTAARAQISGVQTASR